LPRYITGIVTFNPDDSGLTGFKPENTLNRDLHPIRKMIAEWTEYPAVSIVDKRIEKQFKKVLIHFIRTKSFN
jgi:hypothetical protein